MLDAFIAGVREAAPEPGLLGRLLHVTAAGESLSVSDAE